MSRLVVGYCRVSTASGEQLQALPVQRSRIEREGCDLILSDVESGRNPHREGYQELKRLITAGRVAEVVATEFSRLGRDATESDAFVVLCDDHLTLCRTLQDGQLTMATPEDLLLTRLKGSLSQGESMKISQRVKRGLEEGRRLGKPMRKPCWGYRLSADRTAFEADPDQFPVAQGFVAAMKAKGWRMLPTLKQCPDVPFRSCRGVRAWMMNPTLRGGIGYRQIKNHQYEQILWERHEALLTHADYAGFLAATERNRQRWGANAKAVSRALTGLCVCSECGNRLKYIGGRTIPSLKCSGDTCSQLYKGTREEVIMSYALKAVAEQAAQALARAASSDEPMEAVELRNQIKALEKLRDGDLVPVIAEKQRRLEMLSARPAADAALLRKIADPRWAALATYDEVQLMLQQLVVEIEITKQAPKAIRLKL